MTDREPDERFVDRLSRQGEEALGRIAEELIENPVVNAALSRAFEAREKAVQAQEAAMGALNIPSAADVERLTRRLRSVSQRLEGIEDGVDRLDMRLEAIEGSVGRLGDAGAAAGGARRPGAPPARAPPPAGGPRGDPPRPPSRLPPRRRRATRRARRVAGRGRGRSRRR